MIGLQFDRKKALHFFNCLTKGQPISSGSPTGKWSEHDAMILAGVCYFMASFRGPWHYRGRDLASIPPEHREAAGETFLSDLTHAIHFCNDLTRQAKHGENQFPEVFECLIGEKDGKPCVMRTPPREDGK